MNGSEQQDGRTAHARQRMAALLLSLFLALVLLITLYPVPPNLNFFTPAMHFLARLGVPAVHAGQVLEALLNVLMFVPLGLLLVFLMPTTRLWWLAILASSAVSFGVELVQGVALAERSATVIDFVANSMGGAIGAVVAMLWLQGRTHRALNPATIPREPGGDTG